MNGSRPTDQLRIRKSAGADQETIRAILKLAKLPAESFVPAAPSFYIGEIGESIAAVAGFEFYGHDALLRSVAVSPELQNQGIGGKMIDFMIATARHRSVRRIVLLTETAERLFRKKGFTAVDRATIKNEAMRKSSEFTHACPASAVCMVLDL